MNKKINLTIAIPIAACLLLAACGGSDANDSTNVTDDSQTIVEATGGTSIDIESTTTTETDSSDSTPSTDTTTDEATTSTEAQENSENTTTSFIETNDTLINSEDLSDNPFGFTEEELAELTELYNQLSDEEKANIAGTDQ